MDDLTPLPRPKQGEWMKLRAQVWDRDGGVCQHCGVTCNGGDWHADHIIPLSKLGTNDLANLQVLCSRCNQQKGNSSHFKDKGRGVRQEPVRPVRPRSLVSRANRPPKDVPCNKCGKRYERHVITFRRGHFWCPACLPPHRGAPPPLSWVCNECGGTFGAADLSKRRTKWAEKGLSYYVCAPCDERDEKPPTLWQEVRRAFRA